jgi:hypothetical protein
LAAEDITAMLGKYDLNNYKEQSAKNSTISEIIIHPEWNTNDVDSTGLAPLKKFRDAEFGTFDRIRSLRNLEPQNSVRRKIFSPNSVSYPFVVKKFSPNSVR